MGSSMCKDRGVLAPRLGLTRGEECEFGSMTATLVMLTRLEHLSMPAMLNTPHEGSGRLIRALQKVQPGGLTGGSGC